MFSITLHRLDVVYFELKTIPFYVRIFTLIFTTASPAAALQPRFRSPAIFFCRDHACTPCREGE
jgi:hypothetical protein